MREFSFDYLHNFLHNQSVTIAIYHMDYQFSLKQHHKTLGTLLTTSRKSLSQLHRTFSHDIKVSCLVCQHSKISFKSLLSICKKIKNIVKLCLLFVVSALVNYELYILFQTWNLIFIISFRIGNILVFLPLKLKIR